MPADPAPDCCDHIDEASQPSLKVRTRNFIKRHSIAIPLMAISTLCATLALLATGLHAPDTARFDQPLAYYYDMNTGRIVVEPEQVLPPVMTDSGYLKSVHGVVLPKGAGVKAHVFSCESCDVIASRHVGYLERFTLVAIRSYNEPNEFFVWADRADEVAKHRREMHQFGRQIAAMPDGPESPTPYWYGASSEEAIAIEAEARATCANGQTPIRCAPPKWEYKRSFS